MAPRGGARVDGAAPPISGRAALVFCTAIGYNDRDNRAIIHRKRVFTNETRYRCIEA